MSSNIYQRAKELLPEAAALDPAERPTFFDRVCDGDDALRQELRSLLQYVDDSQDEFSDSALSHARELLSGALESQTQQSAADRALCDELPTSVGQYRVVRLVGEGGMGRVFEAQQQSPQRLVAVKLIRPGHMSRDMLRRFRHEADALGQLHHPGIAQIYEAGSATVERPSSGATTQPFFAMELVHGRALGDYVADAGLDRRGRLELFAYLCDAIQHAHQKGVIHRDLKPANILVTAAGRPKVLDFGVARITSNSGQTNVTRAGHVLGTLGYMSPEQAAGDWRALDTRSDVYSLGVILYELLGKRLPLDCRDCSLTEAARIIREERPQPLGSIDSSLRGDVETIVAKTLEKEPARRYQSAGELGRDVRRYLAGEAIEARRDSGWYVLRKQLARYRAVVTVIIAFVVLISGASVALTLLYQGQKRERLRAERASSHAAAVNRFLEQMLLAADLQQRSGDDLTLRAVLDEASQKIVEGLLANDPAAEADVRGTFARTYTNLGLHHSALPHHEWVYMHYRNELGAVHPDTVRSQFRLARSQRMSQRPEDCEATLEACLDAAIRLDPPDIELVLAVMDSLGDTLIHFGRLDEAKPLLTEALNRIEQELGEDHELFWSTAEHLAYAHGGTGDMREAESLFLRALRVAERQQGVDSAAANRIRVLLARNVYNRSGRPDQAVELLETALESLRGSMGHDHFETNFALLWLSRVYRAQGKIEQAERVLRDAVARYREIRGVEWYDSLKIVQELAAVISAQGRHAEAVGVLEDGLRRAIDAHGPEHRGIADRMYRLADLVARTGDFDRARTIARECLLIRERIFGSEHEIVSDSLQQVGWYAACEWRFDEAQEWYRRALQIRTARLGTTHWETIRSTHSLASAMAHGGDDASGVALLRSKYEAVRAELGDAHKNTSYAAAYLSFLLAYAGRLDEGVELSERMTQAFSETHGENHPETAGWWVRLGWHLHNSGAADRSAEAYRRALSIHEAIQEETGDPSVAASVAKFRLAETLSLLGDGESAEQLAREALTHLRTKYGDEDRRVILAQCALGDALLAQGRADAAEPMLVSCVKTLENRPKPRASWLAEHGFVLNVLGRCLLAMDRRAEGEQRLQESYDELRRVRSVPFIPLRPAGENPSRRLSSATPHGRIAVSPW